MGNPSLARLFACQEFTAWRIKRTTATDRNGYFELQIRHVPSGFGLSSPQVLDVFHPTKPLSLQAEVHLDQTKSLTNMVLQLKPERCDEFLQRALRAVNG